MLSGHAKEGRSVGYFINPCSFKIRRGGDAYDCVMAEMGFCQPKLIFVKWLLKFYCKFFVISFFKKGVF